MKTDKYKDLIQLVVEEICETEGLKLGEQFDLFRDVSNYGSGTKVVFENLYFTPVGLKTSNARGDFCNANHIIFDILEGEYLVEKL